MPFTLSHVAAVLPLLNSRRLDPWALAIGAMVPDLPLFLPFLPAYAIWHSLPGILTIDVAATLVVLVLFHGLLREPLLAVVDLPPIRYGLRRAPAVLAGAVIGSSTHVLWDSFTHSYSAAIWGWDWLSAPVIGWITVYRALQYASTLIGLGLVAWWLIPRLRLRPGGSIWLPVALGAGGLAGAALWPLVDPPAEGWASTITKHGIGVVVGASVLLLGYGVLWRLVKGFKRA
ncbi:DUF4184 family protein [Streptosporangium soli]|nr:DUF4184 family protein [Streptosporangium sp. KLBMP 9127]